MATGRPRGSKNGAGVNGTAFTAPRKERYCEVLLETGEHVLARKEVGVSRATVNNHRRKYPEFAEREEEALRLYRASLSKEIHRRGVEGVVKDIYWQGQVVGQEIVYSDRLLLEHARRHMPEYRERLSVDQKTEHSGFVGLGALQELSPESQDDLRRILQREAKRNAEEQPDE